MMHLENLSYQRSKASASVSATLIAGLHYGFSGMYRVAVVRAYFAMLEPGCLPWTFRCVAPCGF